MSGALSDRPCIPANSGDLTMARPLLGAGAAIVGAVGDVTRSLEAMRAGDGRAAEELLSLVYAELRRIAAVKMASEAPGHTLQPTALVHEAWLKLAGNRVPSFDSRAHFFSCAAEAMRRILVESARRKLSKKRGERPERVELEEWHVIQSPPADEALAVHVALDRFAMKDPVSAELVKLLYFAGLTMEEAAAALNVCKRTAEGRWMYARAWLRQVISEGRD
jgi:RNA polymerase sigma factor (TIGR02999 family)